VSVQEGYTSVVTASGTAPQVADSSGVSQQGAGAMPQGYDNTAAPTGRTGVGSKPSEPSVPPTNPPGADGGVDITVKF